MHERGLADDQLIEDHERDRFAPVTGGNGTTDADTHGRGRPDRRARPHRRHGDRPVAEREDGAAGSPTPGTSRAARTRPRRRVAPRVARPRQPYTLGHRVRRPALQERGGGARVQRCRR